MELEKLRFDCKKGSKVMFVLNLVYRVVKKDKVLIFCHNIAPIKLFLELFENVFRWQLGKEVLVLTGDLELFE
jgi:DNA repair and recombination RAD54-like protein